MYLAAIYVVTAIQWFSDDCHLLCKPFVLLHLPPTENTSSQPQKHFSSYQFEQKPRFWGSSHKKRKRRRKFKSCFKLWQGCNLCLYCWLRRGPQSSGKCFWNPNIDFKSQRVSDSTVEKRQKVCWERKRPIQGDSHCSRQTIHSVKNLHKR